MDTMGIHPQAAQAILAEELEMYKQTRFRLTTRLRILNRVGTDEATRNSLQGELERLEQIVSEYEQEMVAE